MKSWAEVEASPEFSALPAAEQDAARQQYFVQVVAPKVPEQDLEIARAQFDKATRIRKQDMAPDIAPSTAGAGRGMAARGVPTLGEQIGAGLASLGDAPAPVRAGPRRGGLRSEVQPYVAADPGKFLGPSGAQYGNQSLEAATQPGASVLDRPGMGGNGLSGTEGMPLSQQGATMARARADMPTVPTVDEQAGLERGTSVQARTNAQVGNEGRAADFKARTEGAAQFTEKTRSRSASEFGSDIAQAGLEGIGTAEQILANVAAPDSEWAATVKKTIEAIRADYTPQKQFQDLQRAEKLKGVDGEWQKAAVMLGELFSDPAFTIEEIVKQAPLMAGMIGATLAGGAVGAGAARVSMAAASRVAPTVALADAIGGGALTASAITAGGAAGTMAAGRVAGGFAAAGDAGSQVFDQLSDKQRTPDAILLDNADFKKVFQENLTRGMDGRQALDAARTTIATSRARLAQALAAPLGVFSGSVGLEKVLAYGIRGQAKSQVVKEVGGEVVEEIGTSGAGNVAARTVDPRQQLTEGFGEAGALALVTSAPLAGLTAYYSRAETPLPPIEARNSTLKRFDEAAAAWGLSPKAAEAVRAQAGAMPADDVPGFLARATAALNRRGLFRRPVDEVAVADLDRRLRPAEAEKPAPQPPTPEADYTGLDTPQEQPDVTQPDLAAAAGVPAGASDGGSDLGGGGGDAVGSAVDGDGRMGGPAADPAPGSGETAAVGTGRGPDAPLTPAPSKFTPEQALERMERQAAEDNQRRGDAPEFEDREATDILGPKGTAWAAKVGANKRLRELGSGYRLARVSTGWVIKPEAQTEAAPTDAAAPQQATETPRAEATTPTAAAGAAEPATVVPGATAAGTAVEGDGVADGALAAVPFSAFNGDMATGLDRTFLSEENDGSPVPLNGQGFTDEEVAALEAAGLATNGRMSREQWGRYSKEKSLRDAGGRGSSVKQAEAADAQTLADAKRRAEERRSKRPAPAVGDLPEARRELRTAMGKVDAVNAEWESLYRDGLPYFSGDGPSRKLSPNAPDALKARYAAFKAAKKEAQRAYDDALAKVNAATPAAAPAPVAPAPATEAPAPAPKPRQLNGSDAEKARALFTPPAAAAAPFPAGSRVTIDGTPYTVTKAGEAIVTLTGDDGKKRAVQTKSATFGKIKAAADAAAPAVTQAPAVSAEASEAAAPGLDSEPRGGVLPPGFRGMTWREAVDKIVAEHGRAAYIDGNSLMYPSGRQGQSNGIGNIPKDVLDYATEALKPKPTTGVDWWDEEQAPPTSASTDEAQDPHASEKENLKRIKEISERQKLGLHTDHMRSDGLAATGWSAESAENAAKAMIPPVVRGMSEAAQKSVAALRERVTDVRYAPTDGATNDITFKFDGKPMIGALRGRNSDAVLRGKDAEGDRALAVRILLDGDAKAAPAAPTQPKTLKERREAAKQAQKAAQPAPGTEAAAPASDQQVPPATAKPPKQTTPPDLSTRVGMVKALKKLGYDASDLDAARTRIPNWGRVGVKLNTIPFKIDMVVELKNERWQFSALESEAPQSISQQEEIAKFKADFAKLIEPAKRAAQAFAPQPVAEPPAAPAAQPATAATHKDPGEPAEPVTPAVVREAIKTAAENTDRTRSEMKAEALRLIDAAIAKAPTAREANAGNPAPKKVTIKVPGDGVFTVVNTEERLKEFRRQIELSPGFKDKLPTYPIGKAVSGGNYGPDQLAREMLEDGEPVNAVEVLEAAGKTMMFGNGNGASIPYTNAEPVEVAGIDDLFVGRGFGTKKGATSWWSVVHKGSGFAIGGSAGSKAEAISEAKKLLGQPEKREKMRALIESGKSADGKAFMTQDELREQFMTEAEGKQQATFNANDASIGLAADRKKREAERDAFYKSIMGDAGLERPAKADWTASSIKEFLDAAEKKGEGEAALKFMDDVVSEYASPHIAEWKKSYDRRNKPSDTGWMTGFQAPGGLRRIRRDVKHPDGTTYRAELDELAGAYVTGKVEQWTSEDGRPRTVQTYSNDMDARAKADRFLDSVVALRKPNPGAALANSPELQSEAEFGAIKQAQAIAEAEREVERVKTNYVSDWRYKSKAAALRGAEADLKNVRESKPENFAGDHLAAINRAIAQGKMPSAENIRRYDIPASQLPKAAEPEAPALDLMGFERIPKGNGAFELRDSNMLVRVEPTDRGKYRASMGSGKSGPNMTEQQAVEWAAAYRAESLRVQAADAKKAATPAPQAAEPEAPANDMRGYAWALVKDGKVIRSGSLPSPQFAPESEDTKLSYYKDMADKAGADLHIGGYPGAAAWAPQEGLIFGMTWDELKARQQKDGRAGSAPEGKMPKDAVLAYSPAAPAAAPAEAPGWHTPLPTQGEPSTQHDRTNAVNPKSPVDARKVSARLAAEAFAAITQAQQTNLAVSGMKLYPWVLPAQGNRNGVVRLLPEDQRPGAPWQQVGAEPVNAGGVRNLAINDLAARLGRAPIIGDEASAARDTFYESLIGKASTEQMSSSGGRTIYSVKITPLMASRQGVEFGRWPETENFALKRMADVTGRPADEGWALIDKREQAASRAAAQPVKAKEGATTNLNKPRAVPKKQALTPGGSLKADATNSRADSAVWYYQGDMGRLRFTASVTIDGKPDLGAAQAKELLAQIKAAQDAGWKRANYRAGSLGTVWVYERGDEFLTRAGMENAGSDVTAWPDIPSYGAGYDNMVRGQREFAAALDRWLNTLPADQQQNQGVVSRKMADVLGGWAGIERDNSGLWVRYYPRQDDGRRAVRWLHTIPASQTWEEARAKIAKMAGPTRTDEAGNVAMFSRAPQTESPDAWLYRFWNSRTWDSEADARDMMRRRIVEDNERYAGMFKPNDPALVDGLEFVRAPAAKSGFNKGKPQVKLKQPKAPPAPFARIGEPVDSEGSDRPRVDWESRDMADDGTPESVLQAYGRGHGNVYRAWVSTSDIPAPKGSGIVDGYPDMQGDYDWRELQQGRGSPPPLKLRVGKNGKLVLMDGNHRLAWWREQGVSEVPAYVIDERPQAMDVPFSRTVTPSRGLSLDEAEAIVGAVRDANPTAPLFVLMPTPSSLDKDRDGSLIDDIKNAGAWNDVEAAYHNGRIYVFYKHIASMERAMFVFAHHELRHHGMRSLEGKRLSTTLAGMVMSNRNLRDAARAKMDAGLAKDMIQGAEEALADMDVAEVQALKGWPKVLAAVRQWLRGMATRLRANGHTTLADAIDPKDWTDADVAGFVSRAEAVSKGGRAKFGTDGTVFGRGEDQSDSDAVYKEMAGDEELIAALEVFMVSGDAPTGALNDKLVAYMRRLPPVPAHSYLTFYRNQPSWGKPWERGWASWTVNKDQTRFFGGRGFEVLTRKGAQGLDLERLGRQRSTLTGEYYDYGSQGEWLLLNDSVFSRAPRVTQDTHDGAPVFASDDITLAFPQDTERFEVIPGDSERVVNYAIMPAQGFDVLGHVELLIRDGKPVSLLDIEVTPAGRRAGTGRKVIETLLAANPDADLNISNIVQDARGFWERMGVPQQNLEQGAAYDGTLNWETYAQAQVANGPRAAAAQGREAGARSDARAEGTGRGAAGEASGLTEDGTLQDLSRVSTKMAQMGYEPSQVKNLQASRKLASLVKRLEDGKITEAYFAAAVRNLSEQMADVSAMKAANRLMKDRERGPDIVRERLIRARRQGDMDPEAVDFALWAIDQNEGLAENLGISVRAPKDGAATGDYNPATEIIRIFKGGEKDDTAVHEIMHHAERMMPEDMQAAIRREWAASMAKAIKNGTPEQVAALRLVADALAGDRAAYQSIVKAIQEGPLNYAEHYQLVNPSEFWAVNAARLLQRRFDAKGSIWQRIHVYLSELVQKVKGLLGLRSDAPTLKALDYLLNRDNFDVERGGRFESDVMLGDVRALLTTDGRLPNINADRTAEKTAKTERAALSSALTAAGNSVRGVRLHAGYVAGDFLGKNLGRLHWWYRSVGTPYNLAQREPQFKPVFDAIQTFLHDVSHYATEAADLAPTILPKLDRARDILKGPMKAEDAKAVAAPVFEGTLGWLRTAEGDPIKVEDAERQAASMSADDKAQELLRSKLLNPKVLKMWQGLPIEQYEQAIETRYASQVLRPGVVWSDAELRSMFKLTEPQIGFYKEFRAATDKSLDDMTVSAMLRVAGDDVSDIRAQALEQNDMNAAAETIRDRLFELAGEQPDRADELNAAGNNIIDMADRVQDLKDRGYAPLSRFGGLTLDVVTPDGERQYFGMFETKRERNRKLREMRENFPDARITMGTTSEQEFKQFAGVTPETLELFGDVLGMTDEQGKDQLFQEYIRKAKSNRSGLKRLIHRKGVPGFSEDIGRVLASFVYSNARQTSSNLHAGTAEKAIEDISQENGNLKDYAIELNGYVRNPQEEAQALRSMMFAQFLGGSIASAMVNMTQPFNVTFPYLSQYGGPAKAAAQMAKALPDVGRKMFPKDPGLTRALRLAEEAGIVSPQEVFHLQAQAGGKAQLQTGDGTMIGNAGARVNNSLSRLSLIWGRPFAFAEQFNRRLTFIAAYRTAVEQGIGEPAEFASQAVEATQFVYNKGNRPPWARGAAGALLFTFKTYSISMMELMTRALKTPEGRRAALLMLGMVVLMAGIDGLPFMEDMEDVIDGFAQRVLDKNWSTKIERNRLIAQGMMSVFGESSGAHVAEFLARGLSGMPGAPIDVSGRLGLHNLIPGTGIFLKKDGYGRDVADIAGPAGSFAGRVFEAGGQLLSGQPVKAAITASPLAVANIKKAADMATTGFYPDTRGNMVVRTTLGDAVSKGIGFQPNTVAKVQELTFQQQRIVSLARMVETEIVATIATARVKKDEDAEAAAWKRLDGWNKKNPDSPISITNAQLVNAERRMTTEKSVRMLKSAPRDLRPGLANALKPLEPAEAGR